jgi:co-chaperonin GroES (HSP10)
MVGRIVEVKPVGFNVLVEMLTPNELMNTKLTLAGSQATGKSPEAYILAIGAAVDTTQYGFKVGDRVLLQGTYVPTPEYGESERERGLVEPHNIKAILEESNLIV